MTRPIRPSRPAALVLLSASVAVAFGCPAKPGDGGAIPPQKMADALHTVLQADRTAYTRNVVQRLQDDEKVIKATESFKDDKTLPLPAQMFRMGAELVAEDPSAPFAYSLQSLWPINKANAASQTPVEKEGLKRVEADPRTPYYAEETLGGRRYFTAIYADVAVAPACVACHNNHTDSPRRDFKEGDVMGGVVIRIPLP